MEELLTIHELAERLKVSARTLHRLLAAGVLPARLVGSQKRFAWPEVMAALPRAMAPKACVRPPTVDLVPLLKALVKQRRRYA